VRAMGYEPAALSSGYARIYMVARVGDRWVGVADPRHNGEVRGR
jgi:gamma-glutamyltranspeptidase/glutathione hydrolase